LFSRWRAASDAVAVNVDFAPPGSPKPTFAASSADKIGLDETGSPRGTFAAHRRTEPHTGRSEAGILAGPLTPLTVCPPLAPFSLLAPEQLMASM
jgi:hypothetical protein